MIDKKNIGETFDNIAPRYDFLNHFLSLNFDKYWRRKSVGLLSSNSKSKVLDIATGTADLLLEIIRQEKAESITGIDLSENMLSIAKEKIHKHGAQDKVTLSQMSCLSMNFEDESFDCATCAFGVRNFSDLRGGLQEIFRVLKCGGEVMILEFSPKRTQNVSLANKLFGFIYSFYLNYVLSFIGKVISGNKAAYKYLPSSINAFLYPEKFSQLLRECGFSCIEIKPLTFSIVTIYIAKKE